MRIVVALTVLAVSVAGCSSASTGGTTATTGDNGTAIPSLVASPSTSGAGNVTGPGDWTIVSGGLARPGGQVVFDADQVGTTAVASVLSEDTPGDYDAGLVYSANGGSEWAWGGVVAAPGLQFPEGVALGDGVALIVGSTQSGQGTGIQSSAFVARAEAPGYAPVPLALPKQFDGVNVHLQDVAFIDGEWVIAGYVIKGSDDKGQPRPKGRLWRSSDDGATWTRQKVSAEGMDTLAIKGIAVAPDESWNLVGEGSTGDIVKQYDAVWLRSTDRGASFASVEPSKFSGDFDQGADRITFSTDGSAAIVGWDEVTDDHGANVSALWVSSPGHGVKRIGGPRVTVKPTTPLGEFLSGVVWQGNTPIAWGSTTGDYPMDNVQFWTITGGALVPTTELSGNGVPMAIERILPGESSALAFGFTGPEDQGDITIWRGRLGK